MKYIGKYFSAEILLDGRRTPSDDNSSPDPSKLDENLSFIYACTFQIYKISEFGPHLDGILK
jgi:hypothetical protein